MGETRDKGLAQATSVRLRQASQAPERTINGKQDPSFGENIGSARTQLEYNLHDLSKLLVAVNTRGTHDDAGPPVSPG